MGQITVKWITAYILSGTVGWVLLIDLNVVTAEQYAKTFFYLAGGLYWIFKFYKFVKDDKGDKGGLNKGLGDS